MGNDKFTKVVLTAIAVLLFVSVGQNAGWICNKGSGVCNKEAHSQCPKAAGQCKKAASQCKKGAGGADNYRLLPLTQARKVLRIDGNTGQVWYLDTRGMKGWRPISTLNDEEMAEIDDARAGRSTPKKSKPLFPIPGRTIDGEDAAKGPEPQPAPEVERTADGPEGDAPQ